MREIGIPPSDDEVRAMHLALAEAEVAARHGEIPVGAVILDAAGEVIASAHNTRQHSHDPTGHAEILAIRAACRRIGDRYLAGHTLVVTLEPCVMCAGAIRAARVPRVIFGAWDHKAGAAGSLYDVLRDARLPHAEIEVIAGVEDEQARAVLERFFRERR